MKGHRKILGRLVCSALALLVGLLQQASAQSAAPQKEGLYGDWEVQIQSNERQRTSILSVRKNPEGKLTGEWISFWGVSQLGDIRYEGGQLSFSREGRNRQGQSTAWKFQGTIKEGKLSGTASRDGGKYKMEGHRIPLLPDIVGNYALGYTRDRVSSVLSVRVNKEGKVTAEWQSGGGTNPISDFAYKGGRVTFKSRTGSGDEQKELSYEGGLRNPNNLDGVFQSSRGNTPVAALRMGTDIIGTWHLEITTERGTWKQRLKVQPDMSGWFGPIAIKKVHLEDDNPLRQSQESRTVTFKAIRTRGERTWEMAFSGKLDDSTLTGEITTPRGRLKVVGKREVSTSGG